MRAWYLLRSHHCLDLRLSDHLLSFLLHGCLSTSLAMCTQICIMRAPIWTASTVSLPSMLESYQSLLCIRCLLCCCMPMSQALYQNVSSTKEAISMRQAASRGMPFQAAADFWAWWCISTTIISAHWQRLQHMRRQPHQHALSPLPVAALCQEAGLTMPIFSFMLGVYGSLEMGPLISKESPTSRPCMC